MRLILLHGVSHQDAMKVLSIFAQSKDSNEESKVSSVGNLTIIVYCAKGLAGDDCICILKLGAEMLETHPEINTSDPEWNTLFNFQVTDVTTTVEVTIHEDYKSQDIGYLQIPLLGIENGEKRWFALKDVTLRERAKGNNPRILMEMNLTWYIVRASLRVITPLRKEFIDDENKLNRRTFQRNLVRARIVAETIRDGLKIVTTCFEWDSWKINAVALAKWLILCSVFKVWMIPLLILIPFATHRPPKPTVMSWRDYLLKKRPSKELSAQVTSKSRSLMRRFTIMHDKVQNAQNAIGDFANLGESVKNLFNFSVPYLSFLAIFFILTISLLLFLVPANYILMVWGVHKFIRKTLRPNRIPHNEIVDLLVRVPNDEVLLDWEELPLDDDDYEDSVFRRRSDILSTDLNAE